MLFTQKIKSFYTAESGRSMIEMLSVLAIVGVLSIAGIAGYEFAVLKFRVNEIINELNGRAISISSLLLNDKHTYVPEDVIEDGFGDNLSIGYSVESGISDRNSNYFEISVMNVPSDVCVQLLKSYENPIMIFVNGVDYNNDTTICNSDSDTGVEMGFVYRNDLGEHDKCSSKGYFGVDDFKCHCSGNTYIDPDNPLECLCPAGYAWSDAAQTCMPSICGENEFESLSQGCIPCDNNKDYEISNTEAQINLCQIGCSEYREYNPSKKTCVRKCGSNEFRSHMGCTPCSASKELFGHGSEMLASADECAKCPNERKMIGKGNEWKYCVLKSWCTEANHFIAADKTGGAPYCYDCNSPTLSFYVGTGDTYIAQCNRCSNRKPVNGYCTRTACLDTEFLAENGTCYSCSEIKSVFVGSDTTLQSGCRKCLNRTVTNDGYCKISPCNGLELENGSCYECNYDTYGDKLYVSTGTDKAACESDCPDRKLIKDNYGSYQCIYPAACSANYFIDSMDYCRDCGAKAGHFMSDPYLKQRCEECPAPNERYVSQAGYCLLKNACSRKSQFVNLTGTCHDCSLADSYEIGTDSFERQLCSDCETYQRFWIGDRCYRCDTSETPEVITDEERDSCLSCTNMRTISDDGKCVLIQ